mgnify:FL=1
MITYYKYTFNNNNYDTNKLNMNIVYLNYDNCFTNKPKIKKIKIKKYKIA